MLGNPGQRARSSPLHRTIAVSGVWCARPAGWALACILLVWASCTREKVTYDGMPPLRTGKSESISTLTSGCVEQGLDRIKVNFLLDDIWEQMAMVTECSVKNASVENSLYRATADNIKRLQQKHPDRTFFARAWEKLVGTDKPAPACCDELKPPYFVCRSCTTNLNWVTPENLQVKFLLHICLILRQQ